LIELLAVVATITLLISILLPPLSEAREHAGRATCGVNRGSIGRAVQACFNESSGHAPTWDDGGAVEANRDLVILTWIEVLLDTGHSRFAQAGLCPADECPDNVARGPSAGCVKGANCLRS
jgi:hypothetical protein